MQGEIEGGEQCAVTAVVEAQGERPRSIQPADQQAAHEALRIGHVVESVGGDDVVIEAIIGEQRIDRLYGADARQIIFGLAHDRRPGVGRAGQCLFHLCLSLCLDHGPFPA